MSVIHSAMPFSDSQLGSWAGSPHGHPKSTSRLHICILCVIQKKRDVSPFQQKSQGVFKSHALPQAISMARGCNVLILGMQCAD